MFGKSKGYCGYFLVLEDELELLIDEIIEPIEVDVIPIVIKKDYEVPAVIIGWILLPIILFVCLIFKQWYIGWFWTIVVFIFWRSNKLRE
jgi:hypothetical protein